MNPAVEVEIESGPVTLNGLLQVLGNCRRMAIMWRREGKLPPGWTTESVRRVARWAAWRAMLEVARKPPPEPGTDDWLWAINIVSWAQEARDEIEKCLP